MLWKSSQIDWTLRQGPVLHHGKPPSVLTSVQPSVSFASHSISCHSNGFISSPVHIIPFSPISVHLETLSNVLLKCTWTSCACIPDQSLQAEKDMRLSYWNFYSTNKSFVNSLQRPTMSTQPSFSIYLELSWCTNTPLCQCRNIYNAV